jgi:hypothetical protein
VVATRWVELGRLCGQPRRLSGLGCSPFPLSSQHKAATTVLGTCNGGGAVVVHDDSAMTQCI